MASPISVGEWQKALEELAVRQVEGFTADEMAAALGVTAKTAREKMRALFQAGRLACVGRRNITTMDGRNGTKPVYRLVQESKNGQHGEG